MKIEEFSEVHFGRNKTEMTYSKIEDKYKGRIKDFFTFYNGMNNIQIETKHIPKLIRALLRVQGMEKRKES